jgi:hypothetical protein
VYHRLRGNHSGGRGQADERVYRPIRGEQKERVRYCRGIGEDEGALPEIVEEQGREHEPQPGSTDRDRAKMPHIGVERLRPGHCQHDRAEQQKGFFGVDADQVDRIDRIDRPQDRRVTGDLDEPEQPDRTEPDDDDRAEKPADAACPITLQQEEADQQSQGQRQNKRLERRGCDFQPFDCAQHRDRWSQNAVAEKQRQAE